MRDFKELARWLQDQGYFIQHEGHRQHAKLLRPNGTFLMPWAGSGDHRAIKNFVAQLRRNGIEVPR